MKNVALYIASSIFLLVSIVQLARYFLKMVVMIGTHHIPVEVSLYAGGVAFVLALWMFIAARVCNQKPKS
jgi:hypothetical protein